MTTAARATETNVFADPVGVDNPQGRGRIVISCDHASNAMPPDYRGLGLSPDDIARHIAWDPGALPVARALSAHFDAPLVHSRYSRLLLDVNRAPGEPGSIASLSETTGIPGNAGISDAEAELRRIALYEPFHAALKRVLDARDAGATAFVTVHTFTPVYRGVDRPWHVGIVHDADMRLSGPLLEAARGDGDMVIGDNEPYGPADRVYHTVERHAGARCMPAVMIEIRNDLVADAAGQARIAARLARWMEAALAVAGMPIGGST